MAAAAARLARENRRTSPSHAANQERTLVGTGPPHARERGHCHRDQREAANEPQSTLVAPKSHGEEISHVSRRQRAGGRQCEELGEARYTEKQAQLPARRW